MERLRTPGGGRRRRERGFTLIEILIVVAIMLTLATVGFSQYSLLLAKARRIEATTALSGVYKLQLSYFAQAGRYADSFDELGFQLNGADRIDAKTIRAEHYTYTINALPQGGVAAANYQTIATGDIDPIDAFLDIVIIENDLTVKRGTVPDEIVSASQAVVISDDISNETIVVVHAS